MSTKMNVKRLALVATLTTLAGYASAKQLNMGGSTTSSSYYPYYTAVANSISGADNGLNVTVVSTGGFSKNAQLLQSGQLDFAGLSPDLIQDQIKKGNDNVRVLWWANPAIQTIVVRKDKKINDVMQLSELCFHPGMTGSSSQKSMGMIMQALDLKPKKLHLSDSADAINAIKNGRCDAQVKSMSGKSLDAATAELNLTTPVWPIGYTPEEQKKIKAQIPWMSFVTVPAGLVEGAPPYTTHALWVGFGALKTMDEQTAYNIVKGMWSGIEAQQAALKGIKGIDVMQQTLDVSDYPLHAGAVRYYRERGLKVPDRLVPPEMK